jgi:hypothetical protein
MIDTISRSITSASRLLILFSIILTTHKVNAIVDDPERIAKNGVFSRAISRLSPNRRKRKASTDSESERAPKRHKIQHGHTNSSSTVDVIEMLQDSDDNSEDMETDEDDDSLAPSSEEMDSTTTLSRSNGFMSDVPLDSDIYWEPPRDPDLSITELNERAQRHKEILKGFIAILSASNYPLPLFSLSHVILKIIQFMPTSLASPLPMNDCHTFFHGAIYRAIWQLEVHT